MIEENKSKTFLGLDFSTQRVCIIDLLSFIDSYYFVGN